jgi:hypothetical protein
MIGGEAIRSKASTLPRPIKSAWIAEARFGIVGSTRATD